jgi:hypothetical protein
MKNRLLLFAVIALCSMPVDLRGQGKPAALLVFDQAHGEQPPPPPLEAVAKTLGLEVQTSADPISA